VGWSAVCNPGSFRTAVVGRSPLPYPFGSNQGPAVADQLGAGLLVNGGNTGVTVKRHEQGPNPSCWSLDPFRRMSQMPQINPNKTGFGVSPRCLSGVYLNKAVINFDENRSRRAPQRYATH
jgi:hypothetical protein